MGKGLDRLNKRFTEKLDNYNSSILAGFFLRTGICIKDKSFCTMFLEVSIFLTQKKVQSLQFAEAENSFGKTGLEKSWGRITMDYNAGSSLFMFSLHHTDTYFPLTCLWRPQLKTTATHFQLSSHFPSFLISDIAHSIPRSCPYTSQCKWSLFPFFHSSLQSLGDQTLHFLLTTDTSN